MGFQYQQGNMITGECYTLVNTVNCVGVMGKGLAKAIAVAYPEVVSPYQAHCRNGRMKPGDVFITKPARRNRIILHLATKQHWANPSRYEWIERGVQQLYEVLHDNPDMCLGKVALPPLGCGLGGLDWARVHEIIVTSKLSTLGSNSIVIYGSKP